MNLDQKKTTEEKYLFKYCETRNIHYTSLRPQFSDKVREGVAIKTNGHWGVNEYRIGAEAIKKYLNSKNIIQTGY